MEMKPQPLLISCLSIGLCLFAQASAQTTADSSANSTSRQFIIQDGSKQYNATISVAQCDKETCNGVGTVQLTEKTSGRTIQNFKSDDLYFFLTSQQKPTVNIIELYDEQSPLIFEDFNFDGSEDLAIRNGNESGYGGPSYDVYVFNQTRGQFVLSAELTALAHNNLGMFNTDAKRQRISTFAKSGCCWHETTEYAVVPKRGLVVTKVITEDATSPDGRYVYVTTQTRSNSANGKLTSKTKRYKTKDYYPN